MTLSLGPADAFEAKLFVVQQENERIWTILDELRKDLSVLERGLAATDTKVYQTQAGPTPGYTVADMTMAEKLQAARRRGLPCASKRRSASELDHFCQGYDAAEANLLEHLRDKDARIARLEQAMVVAGIVEEVYSVEVQSVSDAAR